ncbi:hypothetical protein OEV98_01855 [Caldibacillus lycopersici]|uniref:Uncharacterized protein n=1 Tax=Perspicuibacillus lycopersici TaxID=1325689 RepID=A0AAE3IRX8_9BACI|nr:hypothetical protein [Perspicuibacillus lycopersici]MCU9612306.1 hypothetical protein [Perspicuibacillus lycopersici]
MKNIVVILVIVMALVFLLIGIDLVMGYRIQDTIYTAINPFRVMELPELVLLFLFILFFIIRLLSSFFKKLKKTVPTKN